MAAAKNEDLAGYTVKREKLEVRRWRLEREQMEAEKEEEFPGEEAGEITNSETFDVEESDAHGFQRFDGRLAAAVAGGAGLSAERGQGTGTTTSYYRNKKTIFSLDATQAKLKRKEAGVAVRDSPTFKEAVTPTPMDKYAQAVDVSSVYVASEDLERLCLWCERLSV